ncbi:hypothetical protein [Tsuneonella sp. SYSU-LHT278]|uniref:hypothetical protein n=1 Tax=Tsuneonella sediminis TaxID=3416089 RepID=UPI003F79747E
MSGALYNGYSWKQRDLILKAYRRGEAGPDFVLEGKPCGLCGNPDRPAGEWHSEDYSQPFTFEPPQTYPLCKPCHLRLHKRFNQPAEEWELFCRHVEAGGYGSEFVSSYPLGKRRDLCAKIRVGEPFGVAPIRRRTVSSPWWRELTLDPESLDAAWARPRPLRERPDEQSYRSALEAASPSEQEWAILRYHANAHRRTVTMREIAREVLGSDQPQAANLAYGKLAKRIGKALNWQPDLGPNGTPFWMSVIAEGWRPPSRNGQRRDYELTMVPVLKGMVSPEAPDRRRRGAADHLDRCKLTVGHGPHAVTAARRERRREVVGCDAAPTARGICRSDGDSNPL